MSIISLQIDNLNKVQPAQYLQGKVIVRLKKRKVCKGLVVYLRWDTEGKGFYNSDFPAHIELIQGTRKLDPGEYIYRFRLRVPYGPFSYTGKLFQVHWHVETVFKTGWPFAPKADESFCLRPTATPYKLEGPEFPPLNPVQTGAGSISLQHDLNFKAEPGLRLRDDAGDRALLKFGLSFAIPILIVFLGLSFIPGGWIFCLAASPFLLIGLSACLPVIEHSLATRFLPQVELNLPSAARQGQTINCAVKFAPRYDMHLQQVHFALKAQERCRYMKRSSSGKRRSRKVVTMHSLLFQRRSERRGDGVKAGETTVCQAQFTIPSDAPLTFLAKDNQVIWQITVTIQPKGRPSWSQSSKLYIQPGC